METTVTRRWFIAGSLSAIILSLLGIGLTRPKETDQLLASLEMLPDENLEEYHRRIALVLIEIYRITEGINANPELFYPVSRGENNRRELGDKVYSSYFAAMKPYLPETSHEVLEPGKTNTLTIAVEDQNGGKLVEIRLQLDVSGDVENNHMYITIERYHAIHGVAGSGDNLYEQQKIPSEELEDLDYLLRTGDVGISVTLKPTVSTSRGPTGWNFGKDNEMGNLLYFVTGYKFRTGDPSRYYRVLEFTDKTISSLEEFDDYAAFLAHQLKGLPDYPIDYPVASATVDITVQEPKGVFTLNLEYSNSKTKCPFLQFVVKFS